MQSFSRDPQADLDAQQALLLELVRRAGGGVVSYDELRDRGVEYPASVVSELELAGVPLDRSFGSAGAPHRRLGVRLDPRELAPEEALAARDEAPTSVQMAQRSRRAYFADDTSPLGPALAEWPRFAHAWLARQAPAAAKVARKAGVAVHSTLDTARQCLREAIEDASASRRAPDGSARWKRSDARARRAEAPPRRAHARWVASASLIAIVAIVVALAAGGAGTTAHRHSASSRHAQRTHAPSTSGSSRSATPAPQSIPATAASPTLAAELEARGHALLAAGELQAAIVVLKKALATTGESTSSCLEPVEEACLTYAYALYDLGRALRLARDPAAAVPILEQRLQIDNQRSIVSGELAQARQEAGAAGAAAAAGSAASTRD